MIRLRGDRERMQALRVAKAFNRPDVDALLDELDYDQYVEWCDFFQLEPTGWPAVQLAVKRLTWIVAQVHSAKRLKERMYELKAAAAAFVSEKMERLRWEAQAISSEIFERVRKTGK